MKKMDVVNDIFDNSDAFIKTAVLRKSGLTYKDIQDLMKQSIIEKVKHGYYRKKNEELSENKHMALLFPDGILTMDSALFYYGYSDRTPIEWHMAFDKDTSKARFKQYYPPIKPYYLSKESLDYGVTVADFDDAKMQIFERDRLVCEVLLYENKLDREIHNKAIQGYISDPKKNIAKLIEYATKRRVTKKIKDKIEVWL